MPYDPNGDWYEPGWCALCGMPEDDEGKCLGFCGDETGRVEDLEESLFDEDLDEDEDLDDDEDDDEDEALDDGEDLDDEEGLTDVT